MLDDFAHLVQHRRPRPERQSQLLPEPQPAAISSAPWSASTRRRRTRRARCAISRARGGARVLDGRARIGWRPARRSRRVVRLRDGALLNRYWDDSPEPRPESYREDYALAQTRAGEKRRTTLYRNMRAAAESGWDFSSRWMRDPKDLRTLETTDLVPVDLNSLLYHAEQHHRRAPAAARRGGRRRGGRAIRRGCREPPARAAGRGVRPGQRLLLRRALAHRRARHRPADDWPPRRRSTSAWRRRSRVAPWRRASAATSFGRAGSSPRWSLRDSSGTRRTAGHRWSGSASRAHADTAATTSPTERATRWLALNRRTYRVDGEDDREVRRLDLNRARPAVASIRPRTDSAGPMASRSRWRQRSAWRRQADPPPARNSPPRGNTDLSTTAGAETFPASLTCGARRLPENVMYDLARLPGGSQSWAWPRLLPTCRPCTKA